MRKIKSGKIRWAIHRILILLAAAVFCIAFVPGVQQAMLARLGPSASMVFPVLLLSFSLLSIIRRACVEDRNSKNKIVSCRSSGRRLLFGFAGYSSSNAPV